MRGIYKRRAVIFEIVSFLFGFGCYTLVCPMTTFLSYRLIEETSTPFLSRYVFTTSKRGVTKCIDVGMCQSLPVK